MRTARETKENVSGVSARKIRIVEKLKYKTSGLKRKAFTSRENLRYAYSTGDESEENVCGVSARKDKP